MSLKDKVLFLGLGNYGCKQAKIFFDMGYKAMFANGSEQDLKILGNVPNIYRLRGFDGFGGHRERALDCLSQNEEFVNALENIKEEIVFPIYASGGSTGSGSSTYATEIVLDHRNEDGVAEKIVCPINALPSSDESIVKHRNAYQSVQELLELKELGIGATFFINNDIDKDYDYINNTFAELLDNFLTNNSYGALNNFDESERKEMLRDWGAIVMSLGKFGTKAPTMLEKITKGGIFAPIQGDMICENIAIIHAGNDNKDIEASAIVSEVGKPKNIFEGYNNEKGTLIVASGLNYPISHVSKLGELAQKAYEERQRDRKQSTQKLTNLDFMEDEVPKAATEKKTSSKLDVLRKKMKK